MDPGAPVTEGHLDTTLAEFRSSLEDRIDRKLAEFRSSLEYRIDARNAELRACIEKRFNDQTKWVIGWMTVLVLGAAGLVIGLA